MNSLDTKRCQKLLLSEYVPRICKFCPRTNIRTNYRHLFQKSIDLQGSRSLTNNMAKQLLLLKLMRVIVNLQFFHKLPANC